MLRRLVLLAALFGPATGLANVVISPTAFGKADCTSAGMVTITWTSTTALQTGDIYRVWASLNTNCPSTTTPTGATQLPGGDITATSLTQSYPVSGTLTRSAFIADAGAGACTANTTIYVCVQQLSGDGATGRAVMTGSAALVVEPPSIPVNVGVAAGDTALWVSWNDGTDSTVAAVSYNVTAVGNTGTFSRNSVDRSYRLGGLTNGVTYSVTVTSVSAGGNESAPSAAVLGTPERVNGFWEQYSAVGPEQGGCSGGPAGALALLGVALALRGLRRRS